MLDSEEEEEEEEKRKSVAFVSKKKEQGREREGEKENQFCFSIEQSTSLSFIQNPIRLIGFLVNKKKMIVEREERRISVSLIMIV